jgi:hypothetical protein
MVVVPMKPEYGPTLGRLLSPRWRAASPLGRRAVIASGMGLLLLVVLAVLALENSTFSHGGRVPFSFSYRSLYRVPPDPGGYVKVERHDSRGRLVDSLAIEPLLLPPYTGEESAELPVYATGYAKVLAKRYAHFVLRGEGKTKVNTIPAYGVFYTLELRGRTMWGRDILVLPERPGAREGVDLVMITAPKSNPSVKSPMEVGFAGALVRPLRTFAFG